MPVLSVAEVTRYLKDLLESDMLLHDVWLSGEISNYTQSAAGHVYFTLKDGEAQIKCVLFKSARRGMMPPLRNGFAILAHGRISLYEASGMYQLYVDAIQSEGIGWLHRKFEELKAKLAEEGLFDEERKRPLPRWPRRIGIVTSPQAAALQDILRLLRARYPVAEAVVSPTLVQGDLAAPRIVAALRRLWDEPGIDVIIVTRGGGSIEELWPFNEEIVGRAIAASPIPVVSAVGHETDFTIADFVADLRAPTPSAAAVAVVPDRRELLAQLAAHERYLARYMDQEIGQRRDQLERSARHLASVGPMDRILRHRQRLDDYQQGLQSRLNHLLELRREQVRSHELRLAALSPLLTLERGYAIVWSEASGHVVTSADLLEDGERVRLQFRNGSVPAQIDKPWNEP